MREPSDLIVVGASAGGVEALREFAAGLPAELSAAVLVVLHLPVGGVSALASILGRSGPLPAQPATHDGPLEAGHVYTAVPDRAPGDHGHAHEAVPWPDRENGHRPAVDTLFRSAARDLGRPLRDLEVSYRPVELRGYIDQVRAERRAQRIKPTASASRPTRSSSPPTRSSRPPTRSSRRSTTSCGNAATSSTRSTSSWNRS